MYIFCYIYNLCLFFNFLRATLNLTWTVVGLRGFYTNLTKNRFSCALPFSCFQIYAQFTGAFTL